MSSRQGHNPKRRIVAFNQHDEKQRASLAEKLNYVGSALHKQHPGNYGFRPPVNPRPWKSLCDEHRTIPREEAQQLLHDGVLKGLFSEIRDDGRPKYVWSVDRDGNVYEAKVDSDGYHGYRLPESDDFRTLIIKEWAKR